MRPIDADALKDRLQNLAYDDWNQGANTSWADAYREVAEMVDEQPTADVVPIRRGRWIHDGFDFPHGNDWIHCSECGKRGINVPADLSNYCPNCGALMTEGAEDAGRDEN